jgi:hypothetical protein
MLQGDRIRRKITVPARSHPMRTLKRLTIYLGVQFAYLVFVIVIGALAMAKPTDLQTPAPAYKVPSNESDQDRYMDELYDKFEAGQIDLSEARRLWEEKNGIDPLIKERGEKWWKAK